MHPAFGEFREFGKFGIPGRREPVPLGLLPVRLRHRRKRHRRALQRPEQTDAPLDGAVVEHEARRGDLDRCPAGLAVYQQDRVGLAGALQSLRERERPVAIAARDRKHFRLGPGGGMRVDGAALDNAQRIRRDGLDAEIVDAGSDGALDLRPQQILERAEQGVLRINGKREHAVEERRDRRQLLAQAAVGVSKAKPCRGLEGLQRASIHLSGIEQRVELAQGGAGIDGFEIVLGAEQPLAAGLALPLGDRAQRVEPSRDRGQEALLGLDIGRDRPEQRRLRLVGAV